MTCARTWSVEAARDGRISPAETALVERHLATCAECAEEARRLDELSAALRALPVVAPDDVSIRRAKQRLLAALDAGVVAAPPTSRWRAATLVAAPMALALCAVLIGRAARSPLVTPPVTASVSSPPTVVAKGAGQWSQAHRENVEILTLSEGTLSLRVRRNRPEERVIVQVPDGEIEDRGTTFSVDVSAGHTQRITVDEGAVEFRPHDGAPVQVLATETWLRQEHASLGGSPADRPASVAETAGPTTPPATTSLPPGAAPVRSAPARSPARGAPSPATTATSAFQAGFRALEEGRHGEADALLGTAETRAADDTRAEDALYLRIVGRARSGQRDEARKLAKEYLQRFPRGFRKTEVEALAR